jgi:mono/diheme cytochrome c family protein
VVLFSLQFASVHNPRVEDDERPAAAAPTAVEPVPRMPEPPAPVAPVSPVPGASPSPEQLARGRVVYEEHNCATCHSIADAGNPRNPLDGVGARRTVDEMADWITGTGRAKEALSPGIARRKQRYQSMPAGDLNALVAYLASLGASR